LATRLTGADSQRELRKRDIADEERKARRATWIEQITWIDRDLAGFTFTELDRTDSTEIELPTLNVQLPTFKFVGLDACGCLQNLEMGWFLATDADVRTCSTKIELPTLNFELSTFNA
jgi:hypothetical protein